MVADTIMYCSIPATQKDLRTNQEKTVWIVHSNVGWFISSDNKWATKHEEIKTNTK